jgi:hypothetical protein
MGAVNSPPFLGCSVSSCTTVVSPRTRSILAPGTRRICTRTGDPVRVAAGRPKDFDFVLALVRSGLFDIAELRRSTVRASGSIRIQMKYFSFPVGYPPPLVAIWTWS